MSIKILFFISREILKNRMVISLLYFVVKYELSRICYHLDIEKKKKKIPKDNYSP